MAIQQTEVIELDETATDEDFSYPAHDPQWIWPGVCAVCGVLGQWPDTVTGTYQDPFPRFGADEYLTW